MPEKQYTVLTREGDAEGRPHPLPEATARIVRALRALQVESSYYSDMERYGFIREMLWEADYVEGEERLKDAKGEEVGTRYLLKAATLSHYDFLDAVAALLFPTAPVAANKEHVDYGACEEALEAFEGKFRRRNGPRVR